MATIRIHRIKFIAGCVRKLIVKIDGERVGALKYGQTKEFIVEPGVRAVQVSMGFMSSRTFFVNVVENQSAEIQVKSAETLAAMIASIFDFSQSFTLHSTAEAPQPPPVTNYPR